MDDHTRRRQKRKTPHRTPRRRKRTPPKKRKTPTRRRTRKSTDTRTIKLKKDYKTTSNTRMNDGYVRPKGKTKQDLISEDPTQMKKLFEGYKMIRKEQYKDIAEGTYIRYLKDRKFFRFGGTLAMNKYPDYWVLRNRNKSGKVTTWCVPLKANNVYARKIKTEADYMPQSMKELYKAIESGDVKLVRKNQSKDKRKNQEVEENPHVKTIYQFDDIVPSDDE